MTASRRLRADAPTPTTSDRMLGQEWAMVGRTPATRRVVVLAAVHPDKDDGHDGPLFHATVLVDDEHPGRVGTTTTVGWHGLRNRWVLVAGAPPRPVEDMAGWVVVAAGRVLEHTPDRGAADATRAALEARGTSWDVTVAEAVPHAWTDRPFSPGGTPPGYHWCERCGGTVRPRDGSADLRPCPGPVPVTFR